MILNARTAQELTKEWGKLTRKKKESVLNKLFSELTPDQQEQVNLFLQNYKDGIDYAFNYAVNALVSQRETAKTPIKAVGKNWRGRLCR